MDHILPDDLDISPEIVAATPRPMLELVQRLVAGNQALKARIEQLEAKLNRDSANSSKPPSSDSPFKVKKPTSPKKTKERKRRKGFRQHLLVDPPVAVFPRP